MGLLKSAYMKFIFPNERLHKRVVPFALFVKCALDDFAQAPRQLLTVDLVRWLICMPRYIFMFVIFKRYRFAEDLGSGVSHNALLHNMRGVGELSAPRSHLLIRPVVTIDHIAKNISSKTVLSIGPRAEGEMYNLFGYGFRRKNVRGLDLFSYSPYVDAGNMHSMGYADNSFDVVISGWVLGYSDDKQKCADEMIRVCKNGGVIAIGNGYYEMTEEDVVQQTGLVIGSKEKVTDLAFIERLFGVTAENAYFRYDGSKDRVNGAPLISVFRVEKKS